MPVFETSTRTCSRCKARYAVRESTLAHGVSRAEPPPAAVICVTPWIGWNRS
jgi:hypothetical protein